MKYIILAAAIAAGLSVAQQNQDLSSLPQCGQLCITNMLAKAEELGCEGTNIACLCLNEDFGNGIRDCTNEACGPNEDKKSVLSVGASFCADALAQISAGSIVTTATATALTIKTNTDASATGDATKTITKTGAPVSTASVLVATVTDTAGRNITSTIGGLVSGGVAITTTDSRGTTFVTTATAVPTGAAGGNGTTSGTASGTASLTGVRVTTTNSLGSTIVTTTTPPASTSGSPTTGGGATTAGSATTSASSGAAVRMAAAGFAGVAGLAAVVLL